MERVLIVDDQIQFCERATEIIGESPRFLVVGSCHSAEEALETIDSLKPDVVLMDIEMEGMNGLEATRLVRQRFPGTQVILMSMYNEAEYARLAPEVGALGFIPKEELSAGRLAAILVETCG